MVINLIKMLSFYNKWMSLNMKLQTFNNVISQNNIPPPSISPSPPTHSQLYLPIVEMLKSQCSLLPVFRVCLTGWAVLSPIWTKLLQTQCQQLLPLSWSKVCQERGRHLLDPGENRELWLKKMSVQVVLVRGLNLEISVRLDLKIEVWFRKKVKIVGFSSNIKLQFWFRLNDVTTKLGEDTFQEGQLATVTPFSTKSQACSCSSLSHDNGVALSILYIECH